MSTIKANTLLHSDGSTTNPPAIPALDQRMAKAWVSFNGTDITVNQSYNVSSITDNSVGHYTVNLTTNMENATYAVIAGTRWNTANIGAYQEYNVVGSFQLYCTGPDMSTAIDTDTVQAIALAN